MNPNIEKLYQISKKKSRLIIGLMSGTSLDGLDIALCKISGSGLKTKLKLIEFQTVSYSESFRNSILKVFAKPEIEFKAMSELNAQIGLTHADMVLSSVKKWKLKPGKIDVIASHGQTVFHAPKSVFPDVKINSTLQIGDGDHIANHTGIITVSDFRQKHVAAGGEGAPLAVYGDYLLFSKKGEDRILLNLGGIGNFTYLPGTINPNEVFVTDTGPSNTLIDQTVRAIKKNLYYDKDASIAKKGFYHSQLLEALMSNPFFKLPFPKTVGPELFNMTYVNHAQSLSKTTDISFEDLIATLTRFSAESIVLALKKITKTKRNYKLYLSGGGAHNPLIVGWIREQLPQVQFYPMEKLGIPGDAKEAVLFATLANETLVGGDLNFGNRSKIPSVSMGKISFPN